MKNSIYLIGNPMKLFLKKLLVDKCVGGRSSLVKRSQCSVKKNSEFRRIISTDTQKVAEILPSLSCTEFRWTP